MGGDPGFVNGAAGNFVLRPEDAPARGKGKPVDVVLPDGSKWRPPATFNVGWYQEDDSVFGQPTYMRLPDDKPAGK